MHSAPPTEGTVVFVSVVCFTIFACPVYSLAPQFPRHHIGKWDNSFLGADAGRYPHLVECFSRRRPRMRYPLFFPSQLNV